MMLSPSAAGSGRPFADAADVTLLLDAWQNGDAGALDRLTPLVLTDLKKLARSYMRRQGPGHLLQPTALVNEAFLRLLGRGAARVRGRHHFFAYLATMMRCLLVNDARRGSSAKRGGGAAHIALGDLRGNDLGWSASDRDTTRGIELLALDRALQGLAKIDPRAAQVVELRHFGGLTVEETAEVLGISPRTVKREWCSARLWLLRSLSPDA